MSSRRRPNDPTAPAAAMTPAQVSVALAALLGGLFTAMLSSTIVSTALPTIIGEVDGSQRQYTWIITAYLLTSTMSTPIWGKLADLVSKKLLVQLALGVFLLGTVAAGAAQNAWFLIGCRAVAGLGMGGLTALTAALMGVLVPPRRRSRYAGVMGALMALSIVTAPLIGGVIVDSRLGWRWTFFVCIPLAFTAIVILSRSLHLEQDRRPVRIDYAGALLIMVGTAIPMLLVTFAGHDFAWWSVPTLGFVTAGAVVLVLALVVEWHAKEPFIPVRLLLKPTTVVIVGAGMSVGLGLWAGTTFLTMYFQIGRGYSATHAGLLMVPLTVGVLVASMASGEVVARTGRWKAVLVVGGGFLVTGLTWLGTVRHVTALWQVGLAMTLLGIGIGSMMQNLLLAVQNTVEARDMGAASGAVAFFRSLGGAVGIAVLGSVLAASVANQVADRLRTMTGSPTSYGDVTTLDLATLPDDVVAVVREAYADASGKVFLISAGLALVSFAALCFVREVPLAATEPDHVAEPALGGRGA